MKVGNMLNNLGFTEHEMKLIKELMFETGKNDVMLLRNAVRMYQKSHAMRQKGYDTKYINNSGIEYEEWVRTQKCKS